MTDQISIDGSDISFPCEDQETILDAAERAGYALPYSCRKGVCASCEGGIVTGEIALGRSGGRESGPLEGVRLCQARPCGDIIIAPKRITPLAPPVRRRMTTTVFRIDKPASEVSVLHLRLPIGRRAPFRAGQYVEVLLPDGESRNYSLANAPHDNDIVRLHVRTIAGGAFSDRIVNGLAAGDAIEVELPYGLFFLSEDEETPTILLATGTGFAPMQSIIEDLHRRNVKRPVSLYWGGATMDDLYHATVAEQWAERFPWFSFTPVLSEPPAGWNGASGWVQDVALARHPDLSDHEVYACGNPVMVAQARELLVTQGGLAADNFYADAFVPSGLPVEQP